MGYSHPVEIVPAEGITIDVPAPSKIIVKGFDKELRARQPPTSVPCVPEPHHGKGIRYTGERVAKAGRPARWGKGGGK